MRRPGPLRRALAFLAPLGLLVLVWAAAVPPFGVTPRVFPSVGDVTAAGVEALRDGSFLHHAGQSLLRVLVGTALAIAASVPLGVAMSTSRSWRSSS